MSIPFFCGDRREVTFTPDQIAAVKDESIEFSDITDRGSQLR